MDFVLCGDDARHVFLAEELLARGHRVFFWESDLFVSRAQKIESPMELFDTVRLVLPFGADEAQFFRAAETLPLNSCIYGGPPPEGVRELLSRRNLSFCNLLENDSFCRKNALPTAEGALAALITNTPLSVSESEVLLLGYGRVASACAKLFSAVGAKVLVAARKSAVRKCAERAGYEAYKLPFPKRKIKRIAHLSAVCNTVPAAGIVDAQLLHALPQKTLILELASGADNIDAAVCAQLSHTLLRLPSLPGKVAPQSAARFIAEIITETEK